MKISCWQTKCTLLHDTEMPKHIPCEWMEYPVPGSKRSSDLHKIYQCLCTAKNSWWWVERLPETRKFVIPIKLEFSASVGFIHKEFVTMHGHTILKPKHNLRIILQEYFNNFN